uniref:Putative chemosensory protein n=1 Tax=Triatoma brasiliensis TaxID=65344 RepID=A0A162SJU5_TRIBS|nr:putative chemosensory protein [Triatoma brasiliensis]
MMSATILAFSTIIAASFAASTYTTQYDNIDLDEILNNERVYIKYFNCLIGKDQCTPDGKELKETLPDALKTECSKCTEKQKAGAEKVLRFVIENRPDDYKQVEAIYDPEGIYRQKFGAEAKEKGIELPK